MTKKHTVLYLDSTEVEVERSTPLHDIASINCLSAKSTLEVIDNKYVTTADVIAVWYEIKVTKDLLQKFQNAKCIVRMGTGYDNIDIQTAARLGIPVCNIPDYGTEEVADSAMSHILNCFRGTHTLARKLSQGVCLQGPDTVAAAAGESVRRIRGSVLGIVGLGRIGGAVAIRAKAFGFDVVFYDPYLVDGVDKMMGIRRVDSLQKLLEQSNCVSLHCNVTSTNKNLINKPTLGYFQTGAFLINTARGELVNEDDLAEALHSGKLAMAALDVVKNEPYKKGEGVLGNTPNLIVTPHSAWFSMESRREMRLKGAETARKCLLGEPLRNVVNEHLFGEDTKSRCCFVRNGQCLQ